MLSNLERGTEQKDKSIFRSTVKHDQNNLNQPKKQLREEIEIHIHQIPNKKTKYTGQVRVYTKTKNKPKIYYSIIIGIETLKLITINRGKYLEVFDKKKVSPKKLKNFVIICPKRGIGFHSKRHSDGTIIGGNKSAGCIRLDDKDSLDLFNLVAKGNRVRFISGRQGVKPFVTNLKKGSCGKPINK